MALITPAGPDWAYCTHNLPSDVDANAHGPAITTGTDDADGTAVDLFGGSALTHDVEYLRLHVSGAMVIGGNNDILLTILVDPAGGTNWSDLIPYLITAAVNDISVSGSIPAGPCCAYDFPIWIPAGATVGAYARSAHTSASTLNVTAFAFGGNANPASWWCGQRVTAVGVTAAESDGTSHTPGDSGVFSSWANFGSTLGADCGALQFGVAGAGGTFYFGQSYQYEFGVGGQRIGPPILRILTTNEAGWWLPTGPIFKRLAAGTQLQTRATCNGTAQAMSVAAWAVH